MKIKRRYPFRGSGEFPFSFFQPLIPSIKDACALNFGASLLIETRLSGRSSFPFLSSPPHSPFPICNASPNLTPSQELFMRLSLFLLICFSPHSPPTLNNTGPSTFYCPQSLSVSLEIIIYVLLQTTKRPFLSLPFLPPMPLRSPFFSTP